MKTCECNTCSAPELTLRELCRTAHANSVSKGFYDDQPGTRRNIPEMLALIHSEISEALEEYRSEGDSPTALRELRFAPRGKPEGFATELADVVIRIGDLCGYLDIDLEQVVREKMKYNASREYKHGKVC